MITALLCAAKREKIRMKYRASYGPWLQRPGTSSISKSAKILSDNAAVLVVVTVVAMVALPPLIDGDDRVLGHWLSERPIPRATALEVQSLEEGPAEPVD
jgi:hypothetical protein